MTRSTTRRKAAFAGALLAAVTLAVTACSSGSTNLPGSGSSSTSSADAVFSGAPVASADLIISGSTMEKIKKRGKLVVAEALDAPLLSQQDPTNPDSVTGFDADLAKLLAIYILGKPNVEIVPPASETREAMLQNGTVDVVFNTYTITEERAQQVDFAGPYFESGLAVAVKSDNKDITSSKDLDGKTVIVGANTPAVTEVPKIAPTATVTAFATDPAAVQALIQGRGDAYVQDYTLLASDAASEKQIKVVGQPFTKEPYGIGLKHGDSDFKSFVNDWLTKIQKGGQWGQAWKTTLGTVTDSDIPTPPKIGSVPGS
ncbi:MULTISPECIES: glutamate ABC transporter substrate-binding protein [Leifsonia]|jgi:glutamate transport system substrate-binding protein|uniref:ABC transporter glutamine-binding protein GlnH family protein n=3 Tax=Leifsonia TaxID=110932 RepID=U2SZT6_LEIAQ|nr:MULTISPECIES: glutamate ABC transporter substrate-binding protein [Leifsonia]ERK70773.1 ABC transporter glutamine-binding protein GlnH family protein [Leifsonia aquatica ATCC 14665]MBB2968172.1 glutamate transport system substrate-binding protein [Leifsonia aquatica]NYK09250.1 glutamate transport system substrate-binding protein [Leifsonia naganoensis]